MAKILTETVHVRSDEGDKVFLGGTAASDIPAKFRDRIGDHAWSDGEATQSPATGDEELKAENEALLARIAELEAEKSKAPEPTSDGLDKLNKSDLEALVKDQNIDVPADATKAQLVDAIRATQAK